MDNHLTHNAVEYTITRLMAIAGLNQFSISGTTVSVGVGQIFFSLSTLEEQNALFRGESSPAYIQSYDGKVQIPLFYGTNFCRVSGNTIYILPDILTVSFAILTRYEETLIEKRDKYKRFSYADSLAAKYGFISIPLVDEYAMLLRQEIKALWPELPLVTRKAKLTPTHDVDDLWRFRSPLQSLKTIVGGDLLLRKSPSIAWHSLKELFESKDRPKQDPLFRACLELNELSRQLGMTSEFFFLGYPAENVYRRSDVSHPYNVSHPSVHKLMETLEQSGAVVGFHGGIDSFDEGYIYMAQKARVDKAFGMKTTVGRQHYLRFDALITPQIWEQAGLREDLTLSFFDHEGFMCGTCHPYPLYDLLNDHPLSVLERPLLLMDGTVEGYRGLNIPEALFSAKAIWNRVVAVGGEFVILWHNSSLERGMEDWYQKFYCSFLRETSKELGK